MGRAGAIVERAAGSASCWRTSAQVCAEARGRCDALRDEDGLGEWRQLPAEFPPWRSVHQQFRAWRDSGIWERIGKSLREQGRKAKGRNSIPTVAIVDSQSAKTALKGGRRGYDAGKRIKGRKRHVAGDTEGNLLAVVVHLAGSKDRVAARAVLMRLFCRIDGIMTIFVDGSYTGKLIG